jgi:hypothetical protein
MVVGNMATDVELITRNFPEGKLSLVFLSPASGELKITGRGVKACFDGRSDSDDIFRRTNI